MQNVPTSRLQLETINIKSGNVNDKTSLLYKDDFCILVGINGSPHSLFANSGFNFSNLSKDLGKNVLACKGVLLRPYFSYSKDKSEDFITVPSWISRLKQLKILTVEGMLNDAGNELGKCSLTILVFDGLAPKYREQTLKSIKSIDHLEYLVHNNCLTANDITFFKEGNNNIFILEKKEYELKVKSGEIKM